MTDTPRMNRPPRPMYPPVAQQAREDLLVEIINKVLEKDPSLLAEIVEEIREDG